MKDFFQFIFLSGSVKKNIKITIKFETLEKALRDKNIDAKIRIAPNTADGSTKLYFIPESANDKFQLVKTKIEQLIDANPTAPPEELQRLTNEIIDLNYGGKREFVKVSKKLVRVYLFEEEGNKGRPVKVLVGEITTDLKSVPLNKRVKVLLRKSIHKPPSEYSSGKHVKGTTDKHRKDNSIRTTKNRRPSGQYHIELSEADIEEIEKQVFLNPDKIDDRGNTIHAYKRFAQSMGRGELAYIVRAEMTAIDYSHNNPTPVIHSHPRNDMRS